MIVMTELQVPAELVDEIRREAEAEGMTAEAVLTAAWRHYRTLAQRKKIEAEMAWWESRSPEERTRFTGEYVAVHNKEVVDHDPDRVALHQRIRKRFGRIAVLMIPAEGPREIRMPSFRLERG
jgi:hypothetical protein